MSSCGKKGGNMLNGLSTATSNVIVPFGLLYAQKKLQQSKRIHHIRDLYKKQTKKHKKYYKKYYKKSRSSN